MREPASSEIIMDQFSADDVAGLPRTVSRLKWELLRARLLTLLIQTCTCIGLATVSGCETGTNMATPSSTPPGRDFVATLRCPPGHARVCINFCKPIVTTADGICSLDPCSPGGSVCSRELSCVEDPWRPGYGRCRGPVSPLCEPADQGGGANRCSAGLNCIRRECPNAAWRTSINLELRGVCTPPQREGQRCDGECLLCEPGTICAVEPVNRVPICRRTCTGSGGECVEPEVCLSREGELRLCEPCTTLGDTLPDGGRCCPPFIERAGVCDVPCVTFGHAPAVDQQCCPGLTVVDGFCRGRG